MSIRHLLFNASGQLVNSAKVGSRLIQVTVINGKRVKEMEIEITNTIPKVIPNTTRYNPS